MNSMRGSDDEQLDALFRAYREACRYARGQREFHAQSLGTDRIAPAVHLLLPPHGERFRHGGRGAFPRAGRLHVDPASPAPATTPRPTWRRWPKPTIPWILRIIVGPCGWISPSGRASKRQQCPNPDSPRCFRCSWCSSAGRSWGVLPTGSTPCMPPVQSGKDAASRPKVSPEEFRKRYVAELPRKVKLDDQQVATLQQILDQTRGAELPTKCAMQDRMASKREAIQAAAGRKNQRHLTRPISAPVRSNSAPSAKRQRKQRDAAAQEAAVTQRPQALPPATLAETKKAGRKACLFVCPDWFSGDSYAVG